MSIVKQIKEWWPWNRIKTLQNEVMLCNKRHQQTSEELLETMNKYETSCRHIILAAKTYQSTCAAYDEQIEALNVQIAFLTKDSSLDIKKD